MSDYLIGETWVVPVQVSNDSTDLPISDSGATFRMRVLSVDRQTQALAWVGCAYSSTTGIVQGTFAGSNTAGLTEGDYWAQVQRTDGTYPDSLPLIPLPVAKVAS